MTIRVKWLRLIQVEVHINAFKDRIRTEDTIERIREHAFKAMKRIKSILRAHYGVYELEGKDTWTAADMRPKWSVDADSIREHPFLI